MKKRILFSSLLALVMCLGFISPVAAASNVVINEKSQETYVDEWVYDDGTNYYEVTNFWHITFHYKVYADGSYSYIVNNFLKQSAHGYGMYGSDFEYNVSGSNRYKYDNSYNLLGAHSNYREVVEYEGYFSKYQIVYNFANGEVRIDILR